MKYPAVFTPDRDAGGFVITFPDFPMGVSQAEDQSEALEMAEDALRLLIEECIIRKDPLPEPSTRRGKNVHLVSPGALTEAKAELYKLMRDQKIRKVDLARRMAMPKQQIERLLNPRHASRIDQLEAAFRALGKQMGCSVEELPPVGSKTNRKTAA